jgi:predicted nucleic acid-binding protein
MKMIARPIAGLLKLILNADALTCLLMGTGLALFSTALSSITRLPEMLLFEAGLLLLPVAVFIRFAAGRLASTTRLVTLVIIGNLLWVAASFIILAASWVTPNTLGTAFVILQAVAVLAITIIEFALLRRMTVSGRLGSDAVA